MIKIIRISVLVFVMALSLTAKAIDSAYSWTKVVYDRTNVSETSTSVYDSAGNLIGSFYNTSIQVPVDDKTIAASIAPSNQRIMPEVLERGMIIKNTSHGPMVRVLVGDYSSYVPDRNSQNFLAQTMIGSPTRDFYVPLSEFQNNKLRVSGLAEGANTHPNAVYARFQNAIGQPSGDYVQTNNDTENIAFSGPVQTVNPGSVSIYPPTCDCVRKTCPVKSLFGARKAPTKGASTYHIGLDIGGGEGTTLLAPDRVAISLNQWVNGYGWRTIMRSLTYTNPQIYYAFNHQVAKPSLSVGMILQPGDKVGIMGQTGRVTGPHLHFEVYKNGLSKADAIDPLSLIHLNGQSLHVQDRQHPEQSNNPILSYSCNDLRSAIRSDRNQGGGNSNAAGARR